MSKTNDFIKLLIDTLNNYPCPGYIPKDYSKFTKEELELEIERLYDTITKNQKIFGTSVFCLDSKS